MMHSFAMSMMLWGCFMPVMLSLRRWQMVKTVKPTKEQVRQYMEHRQTEHKPPPSREEIRRQLGWDLIEMERDERRRHPD